MAQTVVLDGDATLTIQQDGDVSNVITVNTETGIASITFNGDYTLTFTMTDGTEYTTGSIRGEAGQDGTDGSDASATDVQIDGTSITSDGVANIPLATSSVNGAMSATDKANLDLVVADYSSALTALGVI